MILKYITLISGFNYIVLALVLLLKKSPVKMANNVLGGVFLMMATYSLWLFYLYNASVQESTALLSYYIPFDSVLAMFMGPAIYYYLTIVLNKPILFNTLKTWLHCLPALPSVIFAIYFMTLPTTVRVGKLIANFESVMWQGNVLNGLFYLQMTTYLIICYQMISEHLKKSNKVTIGSCQMDVRWLKTYFTINISIMIISAPLCFYLANDRVNALVGQIAINIQFVYIFIKSVWQTGVFPIEMIDLPKNKEMNVKVASHDAAEYFKKLTLYMQERKPYLHENCSLQTVAHDIEIPLHHLSYVLNNHIGKSFPDFINEYRINEAKNKLIDKAFEKMTIEAIGYECGFGSKNSFNKAFKKHFNQTPSAYRLTSLLNQ